MQTITAQADMAIAQNNINTLGQFFTPSAITDAMWQLSKQHGRILEPCCGNGAFLQQPLKYTENHSQKRNIIAIEKDQSLLNINNNPKKNNSSNQTIIHADFFDYPISEKFDTIIGNPPYVRNRWIEQTTQKKIANGTFNDIFDRHANLYLYFIYKAIQHLNPHGEIIFITPRDFIKTTGARKLNEFLYRQGAFTYFNDLGDARIFDSATPNCAIWRFQRARKSRVLDDGRTFLCHNGQIYFAPKSSNLQAGTDNHLHNNRLHNRLGNLFEVRVGAVSGADAIFTNEKHGNLEFVCSQTRATNKLRRMIFEREHRALRPHKQQLLRRRIRNFDETNWWQWGRGYPHRSGERIYVNTKTRNPKPFFVHNAPAFDGSVLALFPKKNLNLNKACKWLNDNDWQAMGFASGGRYIFTQKNLENALLAA